MTIIVQEEEGNECYEVPHPPEISGLIMEEKWLELAEFLETPEGMKTALQEQRIESSGLRRNALHLACALHAPSYVIRQLVEILPQSLCEMDVYHQTPLHVAVSWGASPDVISFMLSQCVDAATIQDVHGKIPLHLSWEGGCFDVDCDCSKVSRKVDIVRVLSYASPRSAIICDVDGLNAFEAATTYGADPRVIRALQRATKRAIKQVSRQTKDDVVDSKLSSFGKGERKSQPARSTCLGVTKRGTKA